MRWFDRPLGFALVAALAALAIAAVRAWPSTGGWHSGPLASFAANTLGDNWQRDIASGSAHVAVPFSAAESVGVSARLRPRDGGEAVLAVQWRRTGEDDWFLHAQPHDLGRGRVFFALAADENWSGEIAELTISTLHDLAVQIEAVRIEASGPLAELGREWFLFADTETFRQSSINWLGGARLGAVDWSWWLASAWAAYCLLWLVRTWGRPGVAGWRAIAALALLLWVAADLRTTANLIAVAVHDLGRFPRPTAAEAADALVVTSEPLYRQLVEVIRQRVPAGAKLGFVSADPSLVIRSKYVFYPRQVVHPPRRWMGVRPDYVAVYLDDQIRYDAARGALIWGQWGRLPVRPVARLGERIGLYRTERASANAAPADAAAR